MKKIYTFTLEGDDYPSDRFDSNLRLFAYMLYESVYNYDEEWNNPLDINKNIIYNGIHEGNGLKGYCLDSDLFGDGLINYEPFIVGSNTFGFTINENLMSREVIESLVDYNLNLLKLSYNVKINSFDYVSKNKDDERNRRRAIRLVFESLGCRMNERCGLVRRLINAASVNRRRIV